MYMDNIYKKYSIYIYYDGITYICGEYIYKICSPEEWELSVGSVNQEAPPTRWE
jgi:hypothetical protein